MPYWKIRLWLKLLQIERTFVCFVVDISDDLVSCWGGVGACPNSKKNPHKVSYRSRWFNLNTIVFWSKYLGPSYIRITEIVINFHMKQSVTYSLYPQMFVMFDFLHQLWPFILLKNLKLWKNQMCQRRVVRYLWWGLGETWLCKINLGEEYGEI
jgi:hypothetical protein